MASRQGERFAQLDKGSGQTILDVQEEVSIFKIFVQKICYKKQSRNVTKH